MRERDYSCTILECVKCGAPLQVPKDREVTRCAYCGTESLVRRLKTVSMDVPKNWAPPPGLGPTAGGLGALGPAAQVQPREG